MIHLQILGGKVCCKILDHFNVAFKECHSVLIGENTSELKGDIASAPSANAKKQLKPRLQMFRRQPAVFWPTGKRLCFLGVRLGQEDASSIVFRNLSTIQASLKECWSPVYSARENDEDKATAFLKLYVRKTFSALEWSTLRFPKAQIATKSSMPSTLRAAMLVSQSICQYNAGSQDQYSCH